MRETLVAGELPGYPPEIGAALWRLEDARSRTLRLLKDMPSTFVDQETNGNSIGTILYHLALIEADWLYTEILEQPFPDEFNELFPAEDRDQAGILAAIRGQTLEKHLDRLRLVRNTLKQKLRGMSIPDFHRTRSMPEYEVSPAWVLHHLAQHEGEHRSELRSALALLKTKG